MCDIKTEPKTSLCRGCLSSDRKLAPLTNCGLYWSLLKEDQQLQAFNTSDLVMCWECTATLRRMQAFQARVQTAHATLLDFALSLPITSTLSPLTIHFQKNYDVIFKEKPEEDSQMKMSEKYEFDCYAKQDTGSIEKEMDVAMELKDDEIEYLEKSDSLPNEHIINEDFNDDLSDKDDFNDDLSDNDDFNDDPSDNEDFSDDPSDNKDFNDGPSDNDDFNAKNSLDTSSRKSVRRAAIMCTQKLKKELKTRRIKANKLKLKSRHGTKGTQAGALAPGGSFMGAPNLTTQKAPKKGEGATIKVLPRFEKIVDSGQLKKKRELKKIPHYMDPVILKLEQELAIFMKNEYTEKCVDKLRSQVKNKEESDDDDKSNDEDCDGSKSKSRDQENLLPSENNKYTKGKRKKTESDPEFEPDSDDTDDDKPKKKRVNNETEGNDTEKDRTGGNETKRIHKKKRLMYKRLIIKYSNVKDVLPFFKENEMREEDLKSVLEKEDAIFPGKKRYRCDKCGQCFTYTRTLDTHKKYGHSKKSSTDNEDPGTVRSLWKCSLCLRLVRRGHTVAHMNEYHRYQYMCNEDGCGWSSKVFWGRSDFDDHWNSCHKMLRCEECGKQTKSKNVLMWHMQEKHILAPVVRCPQCPRAYTTRGALQQHVQLRHAAPGPADLRYCVECDVTCRTVHAYRLHVANMHSGKPKKSYPCAECGKVFATNESYKGHYALHHVGKTKHQCHICGKFFGKAQALRGHLDSHNNVRRPKTKPCAICGRKLGTNRQLRHHMYTHTGERPYKCTQADCSAAFTQPYPLRTHLRRSHGIDAKVSEALQTETTGGSGY